MKDLKYHSLQIEEGVGTLKFNRPNKANALNQEMWDELEAIFGMIDETPEIRVVILGGEGKNFCAGMDLELLMGIRQQNTGDCEGRRREKIYHMIRKLQAQTSLIAKCRKPVIANIQGACIGAGLDLAAACDLRYGCEGTSFSIKEIDMGMVADLGSLQRLSGIVGEGILREWAYSGRAISGFEASDRGLINEWFEDEKEMEDFVNEKAKELASKSPLAIRGTKHMLNTVRERTIDQGLDSVASWNAATILSSDLDAAFSAAMKRQKALFIN